MLKKRFKFLVILCLVILTSYVLILHFNIIGTLDSMNKALTKEQTADISPSEIIQTSAQQKQEDGPRKTEAKEAILDNLGEKEEDTQTADNLNKDLKPCPDIPPKLVGPLYVSINVSRTKENAEKEVGDFLQDGGRYKPSHCIALQKVAIIVPFRNRHNHLGHWLYYIHPILKRQELDYGIYIINQDGEGTFNRAKLLNVGFAEALKDYDYDCFVFSDVDLVPMNDYNLYRCYDNPRHLSVAVDKFDFQLPYNTIFGGAVSFSKDQFLKINGFSNTFWGWGGEDDDLYNRVVARGMSISRPDLQTGRYRMIVHDRDLHNEVNPVNADKPSSTDFTMDKDGINNVDYTVKKIEKELLYTFITVDIHGPN